MKFTINGTEYEGAKYDYNTHCEFDALGVNVLEAKEKPLLVFRAYLAISSGMNLTTAGKELEKHLINGGNFNDIMLCLVKEIENSDFFTALTGKSQAKKKSSAKNTKENEENTEA